MRLVFSIFDRSLRGFIGSLVLAMAVLGLAQVVFRYVLGDSLSWTEELSRFLLIWLVLIAAATEIERCAHITVNLVLDLLPAAPRRLIEIGNLALLLVFAVILTVYGFELSARTMQQAATTIPVQMGEVYLALPVSGVIMIVNTLRVLVRLVRAEPPVTQ